MHPINRIRYFGCLPLCNGRAERAPHVGSFVFPLCYRCFGVVVGATTACILLNIGAIQKPSQLIAVLLVLPLIIDGTLQYSNILESSNYRRLTIGLLCGLGLQLLPYTAIYIPL